MSNGLHAGYDTLAPACGEHDSMTCRTCGDVMNVERNIMGATSFAEAMGGRKHLHDRFICPNAGTPWHEQVIALMKEGDKTSSATIRGILLKEITEILASRRPTMGDLTPSPLPVPPPCGTVTTRATVENE